MNPNYFRKVQVNRNVANVVLVAASSERKSERGGMRIANVD